MSGYDKLQGITGPAIVTRDGEDVSPVVDGSDGAFAWILRHQGQSVDYALTHGGYGVRPATSPETTHYLGRRKSDGSRVFAHIRLGVQGDATRTFQTTTHEMVTGPIVELGVSGFSIDKGRRQASSAGQMLDSIDPDDIDPARGWTRDDVASLVATWRRWHLNAMKAACVHMPADAHARWDRREVVECSEGTGYTYGRAWLVELLPASVASEVMRLQSLPYGDVPDSY